MGANRQQPAAGAECPSFPRGEGRRTSAIPGIDWRRCFLLSVSIACFAAAIVLAAYPFLADRLGALQAERSFSEQRDDLGHIDGAELENARTMALAYNDELAHGASDPNAAALSYEEQLPQSKDNVLCWIEIPRIGIKAPVYREPDEDSLDATLMMGAVHMKSTSLPVGGASSNVVITGHTGMRDTRMFDQLDQLEPGDSIILWTLGEPYAYEVVGDELVSPDRADVLNIAEGVDQCTLITCRNPDSSSGFLPAGTYTHRLVVHAKRATWKPSAQSSSSEYLANPRAALFIVSLGITGALLWIAPTIALGIRRSWELDRVLGKRAMSPAQVRKAALQTGPMRLRIGLFGQARLELFGGCAKGKWRRSGSDRSRISLKLSPRGPEKTRMATACGFADIELPRGTFEAQALDDELALMIDYRTSTLVFRGAASRRRKRRRENKSKK